MSAIVRECMYHQSGRKNLLDVNAWSAFENLCRDQMGGLGYVDRGRYT